MMRENAELLKMYQKKRNKSSSLITSLLKEKKHTNKASIRVDFAQKVLNLAVIKND